MGFCAKIKNTVEFAFETELIDKAVYLRELLKAEFSSENKQEKVGQFSGSGNNLVLLYREPHVQGHPQRSVWGRCIFYPIFLAARSTGTLHVLFPPPQATLLSPLPRRCPLISQVFPDPANSTRLERRV